MTQVNVAPNPNVPDAYVQTQAPQTPAIQGVQTNLISLVGTATWGPVNAFAPFSNNSSYAAQYGAVQARKYDMGTPAAIAIMQGAVNFLGVRVTDGTDVAASVVLGLQGVPTVQSGGSGYAVNDTITLSNGAVLRVLTLSTSAVATVQVQTQPTSQPSNPVAQTSTSGSGTGATFNFTYSNGLTVTSKYTGSGANADTVTIAAGSAANSTRAVVQRPGMVPEVFDNILGSGNALWLAIAAAINNGISGLRGPSNFVVASAGAASVAPTNGSYQLTGGTDGASGVTATTLLGTDGVTRTGMYALRRTGPGILVPADCDTSSTWSTVDAFCKSEGYYGIVVGPSGEYTAPATVASNKASAGIDDPSIKVMVGDWINWLDTFNGGIQRLVSPQGFEAGKLASLGPQQSSLNNSMVGIISTQKTETNTTYGQAELSIFGQAGLELITNPSPGGNYFSARFGQNSSSNDAIDGDNYSRMVPFLEYSLTGVAGQAVGQVDTVDLQTDLLAAVDAFLYSLWKAKPAVISNPQGTQPYSAAFPPDQNPPNLAALGYLVLVCKIQLGPIVRLFIINVEAGQTVTVSSQLAS